ncbi:trinucleotide repeat-containing gene 6B protein isoform X4 [Astyanax mexicanus]|uniref:trinucleotide repeat-containing gene 6B protein isoform X4 n=1 Tax=Astyanax mexicanus TaxID=7994 RepID=UPI0020CB034B|nr:trinucleotide repeat-containing gene 6B protein isoform X4 [Astyanax mexicanus]
MPYLTLRFKAATHWFVVKEHREREQQFMEDKKRKKEDKRKRETSQKVVEQKNKVPELTKPPSAQSLATPNSVSPSPGPVPSTTSSIATPAAGTPPQGGNNAKRPAVANGQPSPSTQAPQRYMPREVPPRFRCQQDHKVLLKRGQPPLSSMLLGGSNNGGDSPSAAVTAASDSSLGSAGPAAPSLSHTSSSSSIAASSTTTSSNYANSMWGASSGSQPLSQGREKVIVDGSDLEEWPSIAAGDGARTGDATVTGGADGSVVPNCSASWGERHLQQQPKAVGGGNDGGKSVSSGSPSPPSSSCSTNECMQPSSVVWGSQGVIGGNAVAAGSLPPISKASPLPGTDCSVGVSCGIPGANFNPNANPSAWPALVQDGAGAAATEGGPTPLQSSKSLSANNSISVNQASHQHQLHQMQYRDVEPSCRDWGGAALEPGAGPKNTGMKEGGDLDCGSSGGGDLSASSSSSASSCAWRAQPFPANSKTGASRTDAWESGATGSSVSAEGGNSWGFRGQDDRQGGSTWGTGNGGQISGVSQGEWGGGVGDWGNSSGVGNPSGGNGGGSSSNSSSSGGSVSNPSVSSSTPSTMIRAWDNQKGTGGDGGTGDTSEWGGQGSRGGGGTLSSSGAENSRSGNQHHGHHRSQQPCNAEVALQSLLSRTDLDPRVLSNTGWGQTQIRQNVAWDLEADRGAASGAKSSAPSHPLYSGSTGTSTTAPSSSSLIPGAPQNSNSNSIVGPPSVSPREGWDSSSSSSGSSLPSRGPQPSGNSIQNPGVSQVGSGVGNSSGGQSKHFGGWGEPNPSESQGKCWGSEGQEWRENTAGSGSSGWGDFRQQGTPAGGDWGNSQEEKGTGGWKEMRRGDGGNWGQRSGNEWGERESKTSSGGWGGGKDGGGTGGDSEVGTWGSWDEGAPRKAWGAGGTETGGVGTGGGNMGNKSHSSWGGSVHPSQMPNSQTASLKGQAQQQQQSQPQQSQSLDTGAMQGGWGRQGGSSAQSQSSGWTSGPIPQISSGTGSSSDPSGWEEPSPQSISRKKEIDDGTSAWGDPNKYAYVNYWDKNNDPSDQPLQAQPQGPPPPQSVRKPAAPASRDVNLTHSSNKGPAMVAPSGWGGNGSPSSPCVDNGTAAWGKPTEIPSGWGDPEDTGNASGWGNPSPNPVKSVSKSMQEGWGEREGSVSASRHSSWEEEEEGGVMWNSAGSQGSSSSYNSGGWGNKKGNKGPIKSGDSWINPINRQFSNMGILGEDPSGRPLDLAPGPPQDKKMDGDKRGVGLSDYNGDMRKGGRGGPGGVVFRSSSSKEVGPGEPGPYYDKQTLPFTNQDGCLGEEGPCSPYSPPTVFKPSPLYNHPNPPRQMGSHMFGSSGGMAQPRHQQGVPPINPTVRAQVPHQFLSPQVPGSVLKQMPPPSCGVGGVSGGVFPPQLSPQNIAMLSSIYSPQIQFQLACQLLLQQQPQQQQPQQPQLLQNQRKFPPNVRQQADPQQLARIMAVLQQQRQQQQQVGSTGGSSKLSPSHLGSGGPKMPMPDSLTHPAMGGSVADLHQKSSAAYSGFGSGLELGSMVGASSGLKEGGGQQSRFKWMMEGHSPAPSSPDSAIHKNGPIAAPVKRGSSPYSQYEMLGVDSLGVPSDSWQRTPGNKMGNKTGTSTWPPEFQPGVPWKGIPSVDPESDPYMTPGGILSSSTVSSINDTEHPLLRDNTESTPSLNTLLPSPGAWPYSASDSPLNNAHNPAKYTEYKPSWPPEPIGHNKPWKTNRSTSQLPRPPPGLTHQKQPSVSPWAGGAPRLGRGWGGSGGSQESRYGPGSTWSDGGASRGSCWLVLSNLTPQIDGSTLRTICMQHGPLLTFHLGLTQGSALIRYSTRQEAAKAQSALHMCVLGNTTILAEFVSEEEVARYFAHSQAGGAGSTTGASAGGAVTGPTGAAVSSGPGAVGAGSAGSIPGGERERPGGGSTIAGGSNNGAVGGPAGSGWQSLDGTGNSPDPVSAQGSGLGIFAQWSNGAGGGVMGSGTAGVEPSRQGLWGGMAAGYPSSSLWGSPALEDRHQMSSPAALLPGDLLGGGSDSI